MSTTLMWILYLIIATIVIIAFLFADSWIINYQSKRPDNDHHDSMSPDELKQHLEDVERKAFEKLLDNVEKQLLTNSALIESFDDEDKALQTLTPLMLEEDVGVSFWEAYDTVTDRVWEEFELAKRDVIESKRR